jgi:hypothetical protein
LPEKTNMMNGDDRKYLILKLNDER